jgi:hypothetical protein
MDFMEMANQLAQIVFPIIFMSLIVIVFVFYVCGLILAFRLLIKKMKKPSKDALEDED